MNPYTAYEYMHTNSQDGRMAVVDLVQTESDMVNQYLFAFENILWITLIRVGENLGVPSNLEAALLCVLFSDV